MGVCVQKKRKLNVYVRFFLFMLIGVGGPIESIDC